MNIPMLYKCKNCEGDFPWHDYNSETERCLDCWNKDEIINNTKIHLSIGDRVRVLFGKTINVNLRIKTENEPGRCESTSSARVDRIIDLSRWRKRQGEGIEI